MAAGEEIVIRRGGQPVAKLVPIAPSGRRRLGQDAGRSAVADEFDEELPPEVLDAFER